MPAIGAEQPGDHIEDARLAGARRAEQRGEPRSGGEVRGDDPVAEAAGDVDINRHAAASRHACRSEEHTSELQSLIRISYAVFCLNKQKHDSAQTAPLTT